MKRFEDLLLQHLVDEIERRSDILVTNRQMNERDVEYERGAIANMRELINVATKEIPKKLNEDRS